MTDTQLTKKLKQEGCNQSFIELSQRYENVYYKICQKYKPALISVGVQPEDVYDDKNVVLLKCALTFDPTRKTKFSTWLGNYAKFTCLNYINSKKRIFSSQSEELYKFVEENQPAPVTEEFFEESKIIFDCLSKFKDHRIERIFKMRYFYKNKKESTWKCISREIGVSIQTAINLHRKGLALLKNQIGKKIG